MRALLFVVALATCLSAVVATQPAAAAAAAPLAVTVTKGEHSQSTGNVAFYAPTYSSTWYTGLSYTISYSTMNFPGTSNWVQISYQGLYDTYWTTITYSTSITGSYYWYVPSYLSTGQYRIQVSDTSTSFTTGTSDYFTINGDSNSAAALAVGWIVFIVIAVCCCVACAVCVQYRRRQAYWAANNRYAAMGTTTTTVIIPPAGQPAMQQPGANPAMIYAPDPMQQQQQQYYAPPQNQQQPPSYNPYAPQQNQQPQGVPQYVPPGQYPGAQPGAGQYVVPVYAAPPAYGQVTPVTVVHAQGGPTSAQLNMTPAATN